MIILFKLINVYHINKFIMINNYCDLVFVFIELNFNVFCYLNFQLSENPLLEGLNKHVNVE